jgi:hypothetical protein
MFQQPSRAIILCLANRIAELYGFSQKASHAILNRVPFFILENTNASLRIFAGNYIRGARRKWRNEFWEGQKLNICQINAKR